MTDLTAYGVAFRGAIERIEEAESIVHTARDRAEAALAAIAMASDGSTNEHLSSAMSRLAEGDADLHGVSGQLLLAKEDILGYLSLKAL